MRSVAAATLFLLACPAQQPFPGDPEDAAVPVTDASQGIAVHGRVVDFETCPIPPGCRALPGMVVEIVGTDRASAPTGPEGAFLIDDVPPDVPLELSVVQADGYAATRAAALVPASREDVFDVLVYALPVGEGTLLGAVLNERGVALEVSGGYVGQVLSRIDPEDEGDRLCPNLDEGLCAVPDAAVTLAPADYATVAYVNGLPVLLEAGQAALLEGAGATTTSGLFVTLPAEFRTAELDISIAHATLAVPALTAWVEPGAVTLGFHQAE